MHKEYENKKVILFSGGLDSFIGWHYLGKPRAVYVDLNSRYSHKERTTVEKLAKLCSMELIIDKTLDIRPWEEPNANIQMRNMFLLMIGTYYGNEVYLIVQQGEMSIPDRTKQFFLNAQQLVNYLWEDKKRPIKFDSPFWYMTKADMVKWYLDQGLDPENLKRTVSCYSSEGKQCGQCSSCFRRWIAFEYNNIHEEYDNDITKYKKIPEYVKNMKAGKYDMKRTSQTKEVLKKYNLWR